MKNWEIIDGEYTRKVMWINHEIEMKLYYNGEDEIDGEEVDESKVEEMVEKILENKEYSNRLKVYYLDDVQQEVNPKIFKLEQVVDKIKTEYDKIAEQLRELYKR